MNAAMSKMSLHFPRLTHHIEATYLTELLFFKMQIGFNLHRQQ